jgi:hypothetical protein
MAANQRGDVVKGWEIQGNHVGASKCRHGSLHMQRMDATSFARSPLLIDSSYPANFDGS